MKWNSSKLATSNILVRPTATRFENVSIADCKKRVWQSNLMDLCRFKFYGAAVIVLSLSGCAEPAGSGEPVSIPKLFINCTTSQCRTNAAPNPRITAIYTTSGCDAPDFGSIISASTEALSCNGTTGCYGELSGWIDSEGNPVTTIASGVYSICARIDYDRDYPASTTGDSRGILDDVSVVETTSNQFIENWTDL
jgi:hypothetical protein